MNPLITIGIAAFNCEKTINRAISSALFQTYKNIEIIVVDDGSTDDTWKVISNFDDNRLHCITYSINRGIAAVRNIILEESHGEYIAFFDSDDISHLNRIETQYQSLRSYEKKTSNNLIICLCSYNRIEITGKSKFIQSPESKNILSGYNYALNEIGLIGSSSIGPVLTKYFFNIPAPFYFKGTSVLLSPKSTFQKIGCYDEFFRRCEDTDWNVRFGLAGGECIGTQNALIDYYVTPASYKNGAICNYYYYHLFKKHKSSFSKLKLYDQIMNSFIFKQKLFERETSSLSMLISYPFNLIPVIRLLRSFLVSQLKR